MCEQQAKIHRSNQLRRSSETSGVLGGAFPPCDCRTAPLRVLRCSLAPVSQDFDDIIREGGGVISLRGVKLGFVPDYLNPVLDAWPCQAKAMTFYHRPGGYITSHREIEECGARFSSLPPHFPPGMQRNHRTSTITEQAATRGGWSATYGPMVKMIEKEIRGNGTRNRSPADDVQSK